MTRLLRSLALTLGLGSVAGGIIAGPSARADIVAFEFQGHLFDVSGRTGVFGSPLEVEIGEVFSGRFSYEIGPGNPDQDAGDAERGIYNLATFEVDPSLVPIMPGLVVVEHDAGGGTLPPAPPNPGEDSFTVYARFHLGDEEKMLILSLVTGYDTVFSDDSLPTDLSLVDYTRRPVLTAVRTRGLTPNPGTQDVGQLTSLVLIPESATLTMLALGGAALWRRRRGDGLRKDGGCERGPHD